MRCLNQFFKYHLQKFNLMTSDKAILFKGRSFEIIIPGSLETVPKRARLNTNVSPAVMSTPQSE